jgi:hypothetical protein
LAVGTPPERGDNASSASAVPNDCYQLGVIESIQFNITNTVNYYIDWLY